MKICTTCNETKSLDLFSKKRNGRQSQCKACRKIWFANHYSENKEYYLERNKITVAKTRQWFRDYKATLSCTTCGENHPACLDFHHTDAATKDFSVAEAVHYSKSRLLKEIAKCIVLCANCHRKHHANDANTVVL